MKRKDLINKGERINKLQEADNIRNNTRKNKLNTKRKIRLSNNIREYITHRAIIRREPLFSIQNNEVISKISITHQAVQKNEEILTKSMFCG